MPLLFPSAGKTNITHQHNYTYTGTSWTFIKVRHGASRGQHRIYDSLIYDIWWWSVSWIESCDAPLLINSDKFPPRFKENVYIKVNIFRLKADPLRPAASRCRASCSGLLRGWAPFEEWFDGHINFHVTLFLEGITAKRLSVITGRNVLSYWTASPGRHTAPHRTKKGNVHVN